jgi:hypothetical protein
MSNMGSLSREEQRVIGALKLSTDDSRAHGESTLIDTIHVSADQIEWLVIEGGDVFRDYTAKERRRMATEGRAMPGGRFPIGNCGDAEKAIHAQGRAKDQAAVVAFIKKRVRALSCTGSIFEKYK